MHVAADEERNSRRHASVAAPQHDQPEVSRSSRCAGSAWKPYCSLTSVTSVPLW